MIECYEKRWEKVLNIEKKFLFFLELLLLLICFWLGENVNRGIKLRDLFLLLN